MATTGRLTATQRTAIQSGAPIVQRWDILVPTSAAHTAYTTYELDTGFLSGPGKLTRVVNAGSRTVQVWNPSLQVKHSPKAVRYSFTVSNEDGVFYETHDDNVFQIPSGYQATPAECRITHTLFVLVPDSTDPRGYMFSELTHMTYTGQIIDMRHLDTAAHGRGTEEGTGSTGKNFVPKPASTIITCEQLGAWEALRRVWNLDDATDAPMTNNEPGGMDFIWTVT